MNCDQTMEHIQHALDADAQLLLPPTALDHLATCTQCKQQFENIRNLNTSLRRLPPNADEKLPHDFHGRLMQRIATEPNHQDSIQWDGLRTPILAIAAVLMFAAVLKLMSPGQAITPSSAPQQTAKLSPADQESRQAATELFTDLDQLRDAQLPTPERIYASAAPAVQNFTSSLIHTTALLADSITPAATEPVAESQP